MQSNKMKYYVQGIQKFERQLSLAVSTFTFSNIIKENDLNSTTQKEESSTAANEL